MKNNRPDDDIDLIEAVLAFEGCVHFLLVCILALVAILLLTWMQTRS